MAKKSVKKPQKKIQAFNFYSGRVLCKKYEVLSCLGVGWEGEVYLVKEINTGIKRAAKFFFPHRNHRDKTVKFHAKKLHTLRHCTIVTQYLTQETFVFRGMPITFLISEYVDGEPLAEFLKRQPGKRLHAFQALHLLHALANGIECIHRLREYHGDLHTENVMIQRFGLGFEVKLIDFFQWKAPKAENIQSDVFDLIHIFYEILGGARHYSNQPKVVKDICKGLKHTLIAKQFKTAEHLRMYLENMEWD